MEWYDKSIIKQKGEASNKRQVRAENSPQPILLTVNTHSQPHKSPWQCF